MRRPESTRRRSIEKLSELLNGQYLQRNSPIPLYHQLKEILLKFVSDNTQGTYLPAEQEIASHFGISRPTVRQALKELEIDGHIRREKGRGTYIGKEDVDVRRTYQATFKEKIYVPISMHSRKVKLENKRIGISLFTHRSRYFNILRDNIDKVLSDYGVTELLSDANDNAETQIAQIEDLIARKVDLIIIDPVSPPSALNAVLEKAYNLNIPIIAVNSHPDERSQYLAYVGCDNFELGVRSGIFIGSFLENKSRGGPRSRIAIIEGDPGNIAGTERGSGLIEGLGRILEASDFEIVERVCGNWSFERGEKAARQIFEKHGPVDYVFTYSDSMALGGIKAAHSMGMDEAAFSSIDGSREALRNMLDDGPMKSIGLNDPVRIGQLAAEVTVTFLSLGIVPSNTVLTEPILITGENVAAFYDPQSPF